MTNQTCTFFPQRANQPTNEELPLTSSSKAKVSPAFCCAHEGEDIRQMVARSKQSILNVREAIMVLEMFVVYNVVEEKLSTEQNCPAEEIMRVSRGVNERMLRLCRGSQNLSKYQRNLLPSSNLNHGLFLRRTLQ